MELYSVHLLGFAHGAETFRGSLIMQGIEVEEVDRLVDSVPCVVKSGESRDEAEKQKRFYEAAGGLVEVRGGDIVEVEAGPSSDPFDLPPPVAPPAKEPAVEARPAEPAPADVLPALDLLEPAPAPSAAPPVPEAPAARYCPRCELGPLAAEVKKCKRCGQALDEPLTPPVAAAPPAEPAAPTPAAAAPVAAASGKPVRPIRPVIIPAGAPRDLPVGAGSAMQLAAKAGALVLVAVLLVVGVRKVLGWRNANRGTTPVAAGRHVVDSLGLTIDFPEGWSSYGDDQTQELDGRSVRSAGFHHGADPAAPDELLLVGAVEGVTGFVNLLRGSPQAWLTSAFTTTVFTHAPSGLNVDLELVACGEASVRDGRAFDCPANVTTGETVRPGRFYIWEEADRVFVMLYAAGTADAAEQGVDVFAANLLLGEPQVAAELSE